MFQSSPTPNARAVFTSATAGKKSAVKKTVLVMALVAMELSAIAPVWAAIDLAQKPLIAVSGGMPKPNLMLTVDTSGSMSFRHMPETKAKVNGVEINVDGATGVYHHPRDTYDNYIGAANSNYRTALKNLPAGSAELRQQIYFRSPDINSIYYNPRVRYLPWATKNGGRYPDGRFNKAFIDPLKQGDNDLAIDLSQTQPCVQTNWFGTCMQAITHHSGLYYLLKSNTVDPTLTSSYDVFDVNAPAGTSFKRHPGRIDCDPDKCTVDQEKKNFANWFVYYRTRMLTTKAALSEAFSGMDNVVRVGWTTLDHALKNRWKDDKNPILQGVADLTPAHRERLMDMVQGVTKIPGSSPEKAYFSSDGGTPLRVALDEVGKYFQRDANFSPWENTPANIPATPSTASASSNTGSICRRSYNMLTTDGYYNDNRSLLNSSKTDFIPLIGTGLLDVGDLDTGAATYGNYQRATPFRDKAKDAGYSNTLADFALKYWALDLAPKIQDFKPDADSPAVWQRLTQFTVGLGVDGTLNSKTDLPLIQQGALNWPEPTESSNAEKIDDLWHAAVNTRGAFYSVKTASELERAVRDMVDRAVGESLREAGVATASGRLETGNVKYVPEYHSAKWTGDFYAFALNANGGVIPSSNTPSGALWEANRVLPSAANRNILIAGPTTQTLVPFTWSEMGAKNQGLLTNGSASLVNYLRGDRSLEGSTEGFFRTREVLLGDFVNSTPALVSTAPVPMILAGSNDGMLHGFSTKTGAEVFAFVPKGVLPTLHYLASQRYGAGTGEFGHRYFVDGPVTAHQIALSGQPANVVIGSLGAGGRGLFALQLPSVTTGTAAIDSTPSLLWDHTGLDAGGVFDNVGHILSRAEVGRLPSGEVVAIVGNGVNSPNGQAALLVINLSTGVISAIPAGNQGSNGMMGVAVVRNAQGEIVAAYGTDLLGHLWRYEYRSSDSTMALGYNSRPLFQATESVGGAAQPITTAPVVHRRNSRQTIVFGTGQLLSTADRSTQQPQTFYGIKDDVPAEDSSSGLSAGTGPVVTRAQLSVKTLAVSPLANYLNVQNEPEVPNAKGWALELRIPPMQGRPADYPRVIYAPQLIRDFVYLSAISPAQSAAECSSANGLGYEFLLPARTGTQFDKPVFDTNGDGKVDSSDSNAAAVSGTAKGSPAPLVGDTSSDGKTDISLQYGKGERRGAVYDDEDDDTPGSGTITDRVWQRIQPPPDRTPK
ncbi:MAG: pilus assembly protein [Aquabacterium sp.]